MRRDILCAAAGMVLLGIAGCGGSTASAPPPVAPTSSPAPAASAAPGPSAASAPGAATGPAGGPDMAGMTGPPAGMAGPGMAGMTGPPAGMTGPGAVGPMGVGGAGFGPMGVGGPGLGPMGPMGVGAGGLVGPPGVPDGGMGPMGVGGPGLGPMGAGAGGLVGPPGVPDGGMGPMGVGGAGFGPMGPMGAGFPGGPMGAGGFPGRGTAAEPVTLLDFAKRAFQEGNDKDGFDYLCAHYICNEKEGEDLKSKIKWSPGLKHPVLAVRIGIGIIYAAPKDFTGDPQPVGRVKELPAAGGLGGPGGMAGGGRRGRGGAGGLGGPGMMPGMAGGPGMMGAGMGGPGGSAPADGRGQIDYYTGEFGTRFLESLEQMVSDGKFGDALKDFESPANAGAGRGEPGMGMAGMAPGGMMPPPGGGAGAIGGPLGGGFPGAGGAGGAAANSKDPQGILPGLVMLGVGSSKDWLERRAKDQTLDLLFVFEVKVSQSLKTEIVNNTTTLKLYAVQKPGEVVFTTAAINAVGVTKAREKVKDKDPVDNEVERMVNVLEKGAGDGKLPFVVTNMPGLQPEHAMRRVNLISASQSAEPLALLVEIRAFKAMRLISGQQYQDGVKGLIGPEKAETLLKTDKEADAKAALASFLPRKGRR